MCVMHYIARYYAHQQHIVEFYKKFYGNEFSFTWIFEHHVKIQETDQECRKK